MASSLIMWHFCDSLMNLPVDVSWSSRLEDVDEDFEDFGDEEGEDEIDEVELDDNDDDEDEDCKYDVDAVDEKEDCEDSEEDDINNGDGNGGLDFKSLEFILCMEIIMEQSLAIMEIRYSQILRNKYSDSVSISLLSGEPKEGGKKSSTFAIESE